MSSLVSLEDARINKIKKQFLLQQLRNISDNITFAVQFYVVEPDFFNNFLSGNIGLELEPEPK